LTGNIASPTVTSAVELRQRLLRNAAALSPALGGRVLPHLLQPVQEDRFTAKQMETVLHQDISVLSSADAAVVVGVERAEEEILGATSVKLDAASIQEEPDSHTFTQMLTQLQEGSGAEKSAAATSLCQLIVGGAESTELFARALPVLLQLLKDGDEQAQLSATRMLHTLAGYDAMRAVPFATDVVPLLLHLLQDGGDEARSSASEALLKLVGYEDVRAALFTTGTVSQLLRLLQDGGSEARRGASAVVHTLVGYDDARAALFATVSRLLRLLQDGGENIDAVELMCTLATSENGVHALITTGVVPLLLRLLRDGDEQVQNRAGVVTCRLAAEASGRIALVEAGAVPLLLGLLQDRSMKAGGAAGKAARKLLQRAIYSGAVVINRGAPLQEKPRRDGDEPLLVSGLSVMAKLAADVNVRDALVASLAVPLLQHLLRHGGKAVQLNACVALCYLSVGGKPTLGVKRAAVSYLMENRNRVEDQQEGAGALMAVVNDCDLELDMDLAILPRVAGVNKLPRLATNTGILMLIAQPAVQVHAEPLVENQVSVR
jgi:hypothetical protein